MFVMHRRPAHFICRVGFLLLCVLPTVAIAGWIVQRSLPGFVLSAKQEWEQELSRQLGLRVTVATVDYARPDTAELTNVMLVDPETGAAVASAARLEVIRTADLWKLVGSQCVVETAQLPLLKMQLEQRLLRRESAADQPACEIWLRELTFRDTAKSLTLVDVAGEWKSAEGPQCTLNFRLPEADPQLLRGQWLVERNRQTTPPTTRWQLNTGALPLPCSFAAAAWPEVQHLGVGAQFSGELELVQTAGELSGHLSGMFEHLDLDALISEQLPHRLSGLALCKIEDARLEHNRLTLVRGTLQVRDGGAISPSLLAAAAEQLQLTGPPPEVIASSSAIPFRHLSLGFDYRETGLQLTGSADPLRGGVLIATAGGSLLQAPPQHQAAAASLFDMLIPAHDRHTREGQFLANILPAADLQSHNELARQPQHTRVRMQPSRDSQGPAIRQPQLR
jgi:hypothetical protein